MTYNANAQNRPRRGLGYFIGGLTQSTAFRIMLVWALVFGTWNRSGFSALNFGFGLWDNFTRSPAIQNFSFEDLNMVAVAFGVGAIGISLFVGGLLLRATGRKRFKHTVLNLIFGLIVGVSIFVVLSGTSSTQLNFAPLLWVMFLGGALIFVWWLFYKWATELMGKTLFWFSAGVVAVGLAAAIYTFNLAVDVITIVQVVVAIALSIGSVIYPMMRRRATGTGSTFTSYHGGDDSGNDAAHATSGDSNGHGH